MKRPTNEGQLYDVLQNWFGFGTWDENADIPYYKAKMNQVAHLKRLIAERGSNVGELFLVASYCHARGITIRTPAGLFAYLRDARADEVTTRELAAMKATQVAIEAAVDWERTNFPGEDKWLGQLLRVQGDGNKKEALARWRRARNQ